ncbi:hypothetical protein [Shewanella oncorhynchi]|uniref:hypothetical protein n=1 Tax=Shewanella oncorhynchi TaxID=2726434 RepID=UPI003D79F6C7
MNKGNYIFRITSVVTLPEIFEKDFLYPENIRLYLPESKKKFPLDVGSFAFKRRRYCAIKDGNRDIPYMVDPDSLLPHRRIFIKKLFAYIVTKGFNHNSIVGLIGKVRTALNTVDEYGYDDFLRSETLTQEIYNKISAEIKNKLHLNSITPRKAQIVQSDLRTLIVISYEKPIADIITRNTVKFVGQVKTTQPREIIELKKAYDIYRCLADGLTDFLIKVKEMPYLLKMPEYNTYLFPSPGYRVTPYCQRPADMYNHEEGRLVTREEYYEKRPDKNKQELNNNLKRSTGCLDEVNLNSRAKCRRALAATAMQAYQILFMIITGSYVSEVSQIEFDGAFESNKSLTHKSYRAVKFRAAGRVIQFNLAAGAVTLFRKYLDLRAWVLDGKEFSYLFFGLTTKSWKPIRVDESSIRSFQRKKILGIYMPNDFSMLTARESRKTKSLFLHEQIDVSHETVAKVMNHSVKTNESYYMEVRPETAREQLTTFWDAAHEAAKHIRDADGEGVNSDAVTRIATGHCDDYQNPQPAIENPPIMPNCKSQYGCLFCVHYVCHANDEEDIHKLFSLLYIVNGVINGISDTDKAKALFLMLSARVRQILHSIKVKSDIGSDLVKCASERVLKYGELTPYWENRLQRYESHGIVFVEKQEEFKL